MEPIVEIGDGVAAAELGETLVVLWQYPATLARWEWHVAVMEKMAAKSPQGFLMLNIIASTASPPDAVLRRRMQAYFKAIAPHMRKLIVVALGDSIWLSVVRTIIRALALLSGQSDRQVVVATLAEGIAITRELGAASSASELARAADLAATGLGMRPLSAPSPAPYASSR